MKAETSLLLLLYTYLSSFARLVVDSKRTTFAGGRCSSCSKSFVPKSLALNCVCCPKVATVTFYFILFIPFLIIKHTLTNSLPLFIFLFSVSPIAVSIFVPSLPTFATQHHHCHHCHQNSFHTSYSRRRCWSVEVGIMAAIPITAAASSTTTTAAASAAGN